MKIMTRKAFEYELARRMHEERMRDEFEKQLARMQKQIEELRFTVESMRYTKVNRDD